MRYARLVKKLRKQAREWESAGTDEGASRALGCLILVAEMRRQRGLKPRGKGARA